MIALPTAEQRAEVRGKDIAKWFQQFVGLAHLADTAALDVAQRELRLAAEQATGLDRHALHLGVGILSLYRDRLELRYTR